MAREIVQDVKAGRAEFVVSSGDVVWWGNQGLTVTDSPYWKRVNDTMLKQLPPPDSDMLAAGLEGRWFIGVGNHEVWADPKIEGVLTAVPYLKKLGVTPENLIYKFDFKGARFIFLWSGKTDYRSPSNWDADRPKYAEQMTQMQVWLDEAKANGMARLSSPLLPSVLPIWFWSHLSRRQSAQADRGLCQGHGGRRFQRARPHHRNVRGRRRQIPGLGRWRGGAGSTLPGRTSIKVPDDYPPDLYWKGQPPKEDYNDVLVDVVPGEKTKFTLKRFRPWSAEPYATVELFV